MVTTGLILINCLVFVGEISLTPVSLQRLVYQYGFIPSLFFSPHQLAFHIHGWLTLFTSLFLHSNWLHLTGNLLFLWIFGENLEEAMGRIKFILFYLLSGALANLSQGVITPQLSIPMIGASGAVCAILGAYLVFFPRAKVYTILPLGVFLKIVKVPAYFYILLWFVLQFIAGVFCPGTGTERIAWGAHIGGFLSGIILALTLTKRKINIVKEESAYD